MPSMWGGLCTRRETTGVLNQTSQRYCKEESRKVKTQSPCSAWQYASFYGRGDNFLLAKQRSTSTFFNFCIFVDNSCLYLMKKRGNSIEVCFFYLKLEAEKWPPLLRAWCMLMLWSPRACAWCYAKNLIVGFFSHLVR